MLTGQTQQTFRGRAEKEKGGGKTLLGGDFEQENKAGGSSLL